MKCSLWGVILQTTQVIFHHDTLQGPGLILDPFNFSWLSNKHVFGMIGATQMARIRASIQLTALCPAPGWVSAGALGTRGEPIYGLLEKTGRNQQGCYRRVHTGWAECATEVSAQHSPVPAVKEWLGGRSRGGASWAGPWLPKSKSNAVFHYSLWTALPVWIRWLDHFLGKPLLHSHFVST